MLAFGNPREGHNPLTALARTRLKTSGRRQPAGQSGHPVAEAPARHRRHHRTIWISDIHLGTRGCKAELLLDFLQHNDCDLLYLVGDIVDGWRLAGGWYWPASHSAVVNEILRKAASGTRVIYVLGNHDEFLRDYVGVCLAGIEVTFEAMHETADGQRLLVMHGDHFDSVVTYARWLAKAGDQAYELALKLNDWIAWLRRKCGMPYWSLSQWLKMRVKNAVEYISRFEDAVAREAERRGIDGIICGHIHKAEIRRIRGVLYCNDGDWVEGCTALAEDSRGHLAIIDWARELSAAERAPARARLQAAE
jgi:UDP-2,3-diacylglucosamine pyrophosphatase LpxH